MESPITYATTEEMRKTMRAAREKALKQFDKYMNSPKLTNIATEEMMRNARERALRKPKKTKKSDELSDRSTMFKDEVMRAIETLTPLEKKRIENEFEVSGFDLTRYQENIINYASVVYDYISNPHIDANRKKNNAPKIIKIKSKLDKSLFELSYILHYLNKKRYSSDRGNGTSGKKLVKNILDRFNLSKYYRDKNTKKISSSRYGAVVAVSAFILDVITAPAITAMIIPIMIPLAMYDIINGEHKPLKIKSSQLLMSLDSLEVLIKQMITVCKDLQETIYIDKDDLPMYNNSGKSSKKIFDSLQSIPILRKALEKIDDDPSVSTEEAVPVVVSENGKIEEVDPEEIVAEIVAGENDDNNDNNNSPNRETSRGGRATRRSKGSSRKTKKSKKYFFGLF